MNRYSLVRTLRIQLVPNPYERIKHEKGHDKITQFTVKYEYFISRKFAGILDGQQIAI